MSSIANRSTQTLVTLWGTPGLKEKILFTLAILGLYRFGAHVPMPGIDQMRLEALFGGGNALGAFFDLFSGGALAKFSVFALGITPYINASIIMQLMTQVIPKLEELQKEGGEAGRKKIQQWTRYLTIVLGLVQAVTLVNWMWASNAVLGHQNGQGGFPFMFFLTTSVTLIAGTVLIMWLGELITERGIGNGASLLIMASILSRLPSYFSQTAEGVTTGAYSWLSVMILVGSFLAILVAIIVVQEGARRVPVQAAKRQVGGRLLQGRVSYIPFKVNQGGVMPIIFASSLMLFPITVASWVNGGQAPKAVSANWQVATGEFWAWSNLKAAILQAVQVVITELGTFGGIYAVVYFLLIVFFSYFYAGLVLNPVELANNLMKHGNFIPGVRPGRESAEYLEGVLNRITFLGAIFLGIVALLPTWVEDATKITSFRGLGSTALLIMVGVAVDLFNQLQTQLLSRRYEGFME
ncbi:MAG: preprotein translocase subunit SecY [Candidatus Sericytochromatia bacterium]|nr:preprotein translocase subunit SecY [Candidatus Sericytochromatia bacterium]